MAGIGPTRHIHVLAMEDCQSLDVFGPVEVFDYAARERPGAYAVRIVGAADTGFVTLSNGARLGVEPLPEALPHATTLVVAGGVGTGEALRDPRLVAWLAEAAPQAERVASVCSGAFLLAAAGLLDGRRATTHWRYARTLAKAFPLVEVDPDPVFVRDGDVWTSAGVTAGMDLALAMVEDDLGADVALTVARLLVMFVKRPGGQSQFSGALAAQQAARPALRELQAWIAGHLTDDLSVAALAERAGMTERSFSRAFSREVGQTPAAYVEALRVERARGLLEDGAPSLEAVARAAGFASAEVLRRAFHRRIAVAPAEYRARFRRVA